MCPLPDAEGPRARDTPAQTEHVLLVARSLQLDRAAAAAVDHLTAAGVPSILLKGAAIATWLYVDGTVRPYTDVDLLVSPSQLERATDLLAELGYVHVLTGGHPAEFGAKEKNLLGPGLVCIDLHHGLLGVPGPTQPCWDVLARHTVGMRVGGSDHIRVLDLPARTMHLALHAAQNGPGDQKALADLERGLAMVDCEGWREAARVAEELGASEAFAGGLRLLPAGRVIADELALPSRMTVELALRTRSAPQEALFFERLAAAPGLRAKSGLLARKVFPTTAYLRANSSAARRGRLGLLLAWSRRQISLASRLGPALLAWHRARRANILERSETRV